MTARDTAGRPGPDAVRRLLAVARGDEPADLVLKGGRGCWPSSRPPASTHAHDARNLGVAGMNDADMALAANRLREIGGGQVAVLNGRVVAELPCPVAGLLSELPFEEVAAGSSRLDEAAHADLGATYPAPFMAMSFPALTVLPEPRTTDRGLVDVTRFERVPLSVG
jgi:adenine deaminase